jgi:hypothetical protein
MSASVLIKELASDKTVMGNLAYTLDLLDIWKFLKENKIEDYSVRYEPNGVYVDFANENDALFIGLRFGTRS